jgi:hypothetical protein
MGSDIISTSKCVRLNMFSISLCERNAPHFNKKNRNKEKENKSINIRQNLLKIV